MEDIKFAIKFFVFVSTFIVVVPGIGLYIMSKEMLRPRTTEEVIREAIKFKRACPQYFPQSKDITVEEAMEQLK